MTISFRTARIDDADQLAEEWARAYANPGVTVATRAASFRAGDAAAIESVTVAERDGVLVGIIRTIPFTAWIGGVATQVGGMASVAVIPEARQTGVAGALVRRHVEELLTTLTIVATDGRGHVVPGRIDGAPLVTGPIGALSAVVLGSLRLDAAQRLGLVAIDGDVAAASGLLGLPPPAPLVSF